MQHTLCTISEAARCCRVPPSAKAELATALRPKLGGGSQVDFLKSQLATEITVGSYYAADF